MNSLNSPSRGGSGGGGGVDAKLGISREIKFFINIF